MIEARHRPLMKLQLAEIVAQARRAAMQTPSDIETMLHCWAEASLRHVNLGKLMEISVLFERVNVLKAARFASKEIKPPDWFIAERAFVARHLSRLRFVVARLSRCARGRARALCRRVPS